MLKVAFGEQTLGRTLEEFLSGFSKFKSDAPSIEKYRYSHWACSVKSKGDFSEGSSIGQKVSVVFFCCCYEGIS